MQKVAGYRWDGLRWHTVLGRGFLSFKMVIMTVV